VTRGETTAVDLASSLSLPPPAPASNVSRSILPPSFLPVLPGFGVAGFCVAAEGAGGDTYDVVPLGDDSSLLLIADVMGKGVRAATFAATLQTLFRAQARQAGQPSVLLSRLNRLLFGELSRADIFITAQIVRLEGREKRLAVASAGHSPLLLADRSGNLQAVSTEGLPLGIQPDAEFCEAASSLAGICRVLLYTDGITEARDMSGDFFGQHRLEHWLQRSVTRPANAEALKNDFFSHLERFTAGAPGRDDQTFLILVPAAS
jgi:sigma-B regulation protein RsbU (phosphoserine phosphatase)